MGRTLLVVGILHWSVVVAIICLSLTLWQVSWEYVIIGLVLYLIVFMCGIVRLLRHLYHFPIPSFLTRVIDNPIRRKLWQNPDVIAERMHLEPGMVVVEVGPGKGSYTKAVAQRVIPKGIVYAVDISENVIQRLKTRFENEGITNIIPKIEDAYNFSFADGSVDRIFAVSCLPEIPDQTRVLKECRRILKPDGMICLSELFIDPDYPLRSTEKNWAEKADLEVIQEFGNWMAYQLNLCKKKGKS